MQLPYLTAMDNTSLREGRLPSSHKARRRHAAAQEDRTGSRFAEKLPTSVQLDIRVKAGGESGFLTSRLQPQCTRFDSTAAVSIPTLL